MPRTIPPVSWPQTRRNLLAINRRINRCPHFPAEAQPAQPLGKGGSAAALAAHIHKVRVRASAKERAFPSQLDRSQPLPPEAVFGLWRWGKR